MSSHHYVKEGQEPALVIANGAACSYDILTSLMEWCPYIVVLDGAYKRVSALQIKPDVVIGDFDSLPNIPNVRNTKFIKIEDQENTDLEKALDHLLEKGYDHINVVWATGNRLDHTVNNVATLAKYVDTRIVLYDDHSRVFVLPNTFSKFYEKNTALSLIPVHTAEGIKTKNLNYELKGETLAFGSRSGTSNSAASSGIVKISYEKGVLLLVESTD
ncbi:MAG: thiamine diphosphokinase [Bacteroidia bacterium]